MGPKIWKKQYFKAREFPKAWTDFCPRAGCFACASEAAHSLPGHSAHTCCRDQGRNSCRQKMFIRPLWWLSSNVRAARWVQRDWSEDMRPTWCCRKEGVGVLWRPTLHLLQVSCKEGDQVRWGQAALTAHPNPARNIECPTEEYG